jgi:HSP20 family protein
MYQDHHQERPVFIPAIDIHETDEGLVLCADLPGVRRENVEISVENNVLQIYGKSSLELPEGAEFVHQEFRIGDYYRSFILSEDVDAERISAHLQGGVLTLNLPKTKRSGPRKIEVAGK